MDIKKIIFVCCARKANAVNVGGPGNMYRMALGSRLVGLVASIFTVTTTIFVLLCVCSDYWDVVMYNIKDMVNDPLVARSTCVKVTNFSSTSSGIIMKNETEPPFGICGQQYSASLGFVVTTEHGGMWRLCFDFDDASLLTLQHECVTQVPDRCLYYLYDFNGVCCNKCQYSHDEFDDLGDNGNTTYGTHFSTISFVIVSLILHGVCYILIIVVLYQKVIPVVMMTGILFILSGAFLAFSLAANAYKISAMNEKKWLLPHVSPFMAKYRTVDEGWSMAVGWCAVLLSVITSIIWIKMSYYMAASNNKISPVSPIIQPAIVVDMDSANNNGSAVPKMTAGGKVVQWAKRRASQARKSLVPNGTSSNGLIMEGNF